MNLRFFGGANEIGASSTRIEIEGVRLVVDAGIRMGPDQDSPLPDFSEFDKTGMPDAVLLTHAHTDHTGALPVLHNMLSADVKIYCTPATQAITRVLLEDSARRMERGEENDEALRYTLADVAAVLNRMKPVGWLEPIEVCPGVTATWIKVCPAVDVRLPENGRSYLVKKRIGISRGRRFSNDRISEVAAFVRKMERNGPFRVWELAEIWFGTEGITPVGVEFFKWCLSLESRFFERRSGDVFFLRQIV